MAKPLRIFLVRHGESEGNINRNRYTEIPDHFLQLTERGWIQSKEAGKSIQSKILSNEKQISASKRSIVKCLVYCSTFKRSRQTFEGMKPYLQFTGYQAYDYREDPRIREQEWGNFRNHYSKDEIDSERRNYGSFYYRIPQGESGADVYDRISIFLHTLFRDFDKSDFPENVIFISHGFTIRIFLMRWFHWTPEKFEELINPKNGEVIELNLNKDTQKYELKSQLNYKQKS